MRVTAVLTLLTAVLPFAYASDLLFTKPPKCRNMKLRCSGNIVEQCNSSGRENSWHRMYTCPEDTKCIVVDDPELERCECRPITSERSVNIFAAEVACKPGAQRCGNDKTIQKCGNHGNWETKECSQGETCDSLSGACQTPEEHRCKDNNVRCRGDTIEVCVRGKWFARETCGNDEICAMSGRGGGMPHCRKPLSTIPHSSIPEPCNPGNRTCDKNFYVLRICNKNQTWELEKKCTTPGDCKIDGPWQAHCERGGINPPKFARTEQQCEPRSRACDHDRRFHFVCNENGRWDEPTQCFRDGYCTADTHHSLACASWPLYDGKNDKCDAHCESLSYLYCAGGSPDRARWANCLSNMCKEETCKACDRCNYRLPYDGVKPDLTTLVPGDRFDD